MRVGATVGTASGATATRVARSVAGARVSARLTDVSVEDGLSDRVANAEVLRPVKTARDVAVAPRFKQPAPVLLRPRVVVPA